MKLTPHFTLEELCYTSVKDFKETNLKQAKDNLGKMYMLAGFAERVREIISKPLIVSSGYRCQELNKYLGGSKTSQHCLGEAIDIICKDLSIKNMYNKIKKSDLKYDQMIIECNSKGDEWLHISIGSKKENLSYKCCKYERIV